MRVRAILIIALILPAPASAAETITYTYDARGRLVEAAHSGTVNDGVTSGYSYDKADNRTTVIVTIGEQFSLNLFGASGTDSSEAQVSSTISDANEASGTACHVC